MKHLKVWQKLALMGVVFMLPVAVVSSKLLSTINEHGVEFARHEIRGLEYYTPLLALLKDLQQHRGMSNAVLNGDTSFRDQLTGKRSDLENDIKAVDEVDQRLDNAMRTGKKWSALRTTCRDLLNNTRPSAEKSFSQHTAAIDDTLALISAVGDASKLSEDPNVDTYYLLNFLMLKGPELGEVLAQARGIGSGIAATTHRTPQQLESLKRLAILAGFLEKRLDKSLNKAFTFNESLRPELEAGVRANAEALRSAHEQIEKLAGAGTEHVSAADYYQALSRSVNLTFDLEQQVTTVARGLLEKRIENHQRELVLTLGWTALGLLAVCAIGVFIIRDVTRSLRHVVGVANRIAIGDLSVDVASKSRKDEIGVLADAFDRMVTALKEMVGVAERIAAGDLAVSVKPRSDQDVLGHALVNMIDRLSALVGDVQRSGIQVNTSVVEIAATARQQQATASEIAATTTEIGATSKEISATSKELVKTMNEVSGVAEQSATLAGSGQVGVTRMEQTMRHVMEAAASINAKLGVLNEKAGNINQVVTTITKVADQTNLLSLNAAIEAEKAGEYGRGFAVVATEIRRLADQTAVATYDIEQMVKEIQSAVSAGVMGMDKFSQEVRRGMQDVQQVGDQLSQIIAQVQALPPRFEAVNEGMQAQATGAEQITQALAQLSDAAQQTVDSLRQSTQAIDGLNQAASGMRSGVSRFKVAA